MVVIRPTTTRSLSLAIGATIKGFRSDVRHPKFVIGVSTLGATLAFGCGSELVVKDAATDASDDTTVTDANDETDATTDAPDDLWTPCGIRPRYGVFSCCDGAPCRGSCETVNGAYGCWCGSIPGGCSSVSTCCGGCKSEEECKWSMGQ